ncbi:acetyltransferase, GNAT family, putative [Plasmodium malariae]|uniref:N-alpha-acetyltransferase 40 n=1 Tax=Plasmodium malariae TaxID=5858 RepID=A0A1D3SPI7_PLAMA|nr:acetyltransferase, GNAT family, putative [Plasmodium malariae]SCO93817.1 acetyltransferase, GNAT family, putative [Plasmodium malariae]
MKKLKDDIKVSQSGKINRTKKKSINKSEQNVKNTNGSKNKDVKDDKEIVKRVKRCRSNDNIFNFIDAKYRKYFLRWGNTTKMACKVECKGKSVDRYADQRVDRYADQRVDRYADQRVDRYADQRVDRYADQRVDRYVDQRVMGSHVVFFESINAYELKKYSVSEVLFRTLLEITKVNMEGLYNESNFLNRGWIDSTKWKELTSDRCKLILGFIKYCESCNNNTNDCNFVGNDKLSEDCVEGEDNFLNILKCNNIEKMNKYLCKNKLICFVHYRLTPDYYPYEKNIICYLYEIQIVYDYTKLGLGKYLISMLENLCKHIKLKKIICTVLKNNINAVSFYKNKCSFEIDDSSPDNFPSDNSKPCPYEILKKEIQL